MAFEWQTTGEVVRGALWAGVGGGKADWSLIQYFRPEMTDLPGTSFPIPFLITYWCNFILSVNLYKWSITDDVQTCVFYYHGISTYFFPLVLLLIVLLKVLFVLFPLLLLF